MNWDMDSVIIRFHLLVAIFAIFGLVANFSWFIGAGLAAGSLFVSAVVVRVSLWAVPLLLGSVAFQWLCDLGKTCEDP